MTEMIQQAITQEKNQQALRVAGQMFEQDPDWVTFFREVLGVDGVVRRLFPSQEEIAAFEQSDAYTGIQNMVAELRRRRDGKPDDKEPTRVITVRLPQSLHQSLKVEARDRNTSMNKLCISKLLQVIGDSLIATEETEDEEQPGNAAPQAHFESA